MAIPTHALAVPRPGPRPDGGPARAVGRARPGPRRERGPVLRAVRRDAPVRLGGPGPVRPTRPRLPSARLPGSRPAASTDAGSAMSSATNRARSTACDGVPAHAHARRPRPAPSRGRAERVRTAGPSGGGRPPSGGDRSGPPVPVGCRDCPGAREDRSGSVLAPVSHPGVHHPGVSPGIPPGPLVAVAGRFADGPDGFADRAGPRSGGPGGDTVCVRAYMADVIPCPTFNRGFRPCEVTACPASSSFPTPRVRFPAPRVLRRVRRQVHPGGAGRRRGRGRRRVRQGEGGSRVRA